MNHFIVTYAVEEPDDDYFVVRLDFYKIVLVPSDNSEPDEDGRIPNVHVPVKTFSIRAQRDVDGGDVYGTAPTFRDVPVDIIVLAGDDVLELGSSLSEYLRKNKSGSCTKLVSGIVRKLASNDGYCKFLLSCGASVPSAKDSYYALQQNDDENIIGADDFVDNVGRKEGAWDYVVSRNKPAAVG